MLPQTTVKCITTGMISGSKLLTLISILLYPADLLVRFYSFNILLVQKI